MKEETEKRGSPRRLLSIAGAAETLGISTSGVKRLIRSGALPMIEVGDAVRIPPAAIDRLVQAKVHDGKPANVEAAVDVWGPWMSCARDRRKSSRPFNSSARRSPRS